MAMLNNQMVTGIWWEYATNIIWLVVSTNPSEKYESIGIMTFPMEKLNSCSKPPTSHHLQWDMIYIYTLW